MNSITSWLHDSSTLTRALLKNQLWPLLLLFGVGCAINLSIENALQLPALTDNERIIYPLTLGLWELTEGIILFLLLCRGVSQVRQPRSAKILGKPFATPYLGSFLAEYLRMLAQVLLWTLALLVPGLVRYCQLIFVPYIAIFSKSYRDGEADALKLSRELTRPKMALIATVFLVTVLIQIGLSYGPQLIEALHTLPIRAGFMVIEFIFAAFSYSLMFLLYEEAAA